MQETCQQGKAAFSKEMEISAAQLLLDRQHGAQILRGWNFILCVPAPLCLK
jgi:hypothetical protein